MTKDKKSYKLTKIIKSALAVVVLPVFAIYIMVAKPDYNITNSLAHFFMPIVNFAGNVITWPIYAIGHGVHWVRETSLLRAENENLRKKLDEALSNKYACDVAIVENKKLEQEITVKHASPYGAIIADIQFDDSAFHHNNFFINKGTKSGITRGMVVVSFDNRLVGIISDCGSAFCRVRALTDSNSTIAIRIAGTDISGFLHGNGKKDATVGLFSDAQFMGRKGLKIITSNISGILPPGIYVGDMIDETSVDVLRPTNVSRVMVLKYNNQDSYK